MKKIALILAALLLLASIAGCGTSADSDKAYVQNKGKLVVGITDFAPMDYHGDNGEWIGFDADMAKAFAEELGVEIEFVEIAWGNKAIELQTKAIDVVWNGMTIDDEVKGLMGVSDAYCKNAQVVVVKADIADQYQTEDSLKELRFAAENGSAGEKLLKEMEIECTPVDNQAKALMEVASGSVDACVIDLLMAGAMIGEGTSYENLTMTLSLTEEEYGVGFRKDSDLIKEFNSFWKKMYDNGTVKTTAEKYDIAKNIIEK